MPDPVEVPAVEEPTAGAAKKAGKAIVVAGGPIPKGYDFVVVVEGRTYGLAKEAGEPASITVKKGDYPAGADAYLRYERGVTFPDDAKAVLTMGENVLQNNFGGFTRAAGHLNVGPAHPAYAGANLAYQHGFTTIDITGLTDVEKARLRTFFDGLATHPAEPAQVTVSLI